MTGSGSPTTLPRSPIPGDPDQVRAMAEHYRAIAEQIAGSAARLTALQRGQTSSEAIEAFLAKADDLAGHLRKVHGRYQGTGDALSDYATSLQSAIQEAEPAAQQHNATMADAADAQKLDAHYQSLADAATDPTEHAQFQQQAEARRSAAADAQAEAERLAAVVRSAEADRDRAAAAAIARIDVSTDDGIHDNAFDRFSHWMKENDGWISVVLKVVQVAGTILALAALVFPLTAPLAWAAIAVMAIASAGDVLKASAGTGSWADVGLDALSLATFGAGKIVVGVGRSATSAVAFSRAGGLVREGDSAASAIARVNRSFARIPREGIRPAYRIAAAGDDDIAHMMQWADRSRVGAIHSDPVALAKLRRTLAVGRGLAWTGVGADLFGEADGRIPAWTDLETRTTARFGLGTKW